MDQLPHIALGPSPSVSPCLYASLNRTHPPFQSTLLDPQGGRPTDEALVAQEVADLVDRVGCRRCMAWSKSDAVVARIKTASPELRVGYVVVNETAAHRAAGLHRLLRLPSAEVRVLGTVFDTDTHASGFKAMHRWLSIADTYSRVFGCWHNLRVCGA